MSRAAWLCALAISVGCGSASSDPAASNASAGAASAAAATTGVGQVVGLPKVAGVPKDNSLLHLEVTEAGFFPAGAASPGRRFYTVGLRGTSRSASAQLLGQSKGDDVMIDVRRFVFAQNDRGCISRPEMETTGVTNLFGDQMTFSPGKNTEGRLVFMVPNDTQRVRVLIAPAGADGLAVTAGPDFTPAWPKPIHTIDDGTTMKILVLPIPTLPAGLPPPSAGKELVVLDVVVQNLSAENGIEFQPSQQLRLMDASGAFVQAAPATQQLGCHMDDGDVIPPGQFRRLVAIYEMPAGGSRRLHYRGFETEEAIVDIR